MFEMQRGVASKKGRVNVKEVKLKRMELIDYILHIAPVIRAMICHLEDVTLQDIVGVIPDPCSTRNA